MTTLSTTTNRRPQEESEAGLWNLLVQQDDNTLQPQAEETKKSQKLDCETL